MSEIARPPATGPVAAARLAAWLTAAFPIAGQLRDYRSQWLVRDVAAGFAIAAVALPIGIAYPAIAGLSPEIGLYTSIVALVGYAVFGSSRQVVVGPDTATMMVLAAALAQLSITGAEERAVISALLSLIVGILCLLSALLRLGFIANFLSRPVLTGYLCGISLSLFVGQIGRLTTVHTQSSGLVRPIVHLARHLDLVHLPTLATGVGLFLLSRLFVRLAPRAPGPLMVLAVGTFLSAIFDLHSWGVSLLGRIPEGLPRFALPPGLTGELDDLTLSALGILVVAFGSGIVTARSFGARNHYRVDANRELIGFGAANIACGLVGGFPVTGADSRTAINSSVGGRTQLAGLVAAAVLILIVATLTGVLQYLPIAALGAVLASAAVDLFDLAELRRLWRTSRIEFLFAVIAMIGVVGLGVLKGVMIAVGATGIYLLARVSRPTDGLLGCIPGHAGFYKLHREPRAKAIPGLSIYLVQGALVFFNIDYVRDRINWVMDRMPRSTRWFILDAEDVMAVDSTAASILDDIREEFNRRQIRFGLARLHSQPRQLLLNAGVLASIGPEMVFERVEDAVAAFEKDQTQPAELPPPAGLPAGFRPDDL